MVETDEEGIRRRMGYVRALGETRRSRAEKKIRMLTIRMGMQDLRNRAADLIRRRDILIARLRSGELTPEQYEVTDQEIRVLNQQAKNLIKRHNNVVSLSRDYEEFIRLKSDIFLPDEERDIKEVGNVEEEPGLEEYYQDYYPPPTAEALAMLQRLGLRPSEPSE